MTGWIGGDSVPGYAASLSNKGLTYGQEKSVLDKQIVILMVMWLVYFLVHSLLASLTVKQFVADRWPGLMPWYRLLFNILASVLVLPPLYVLYSYPGDTLWAWRGLWFYVANGIALTALLAVFWSMRFYDGGEFLGVRQLREHRRDVADQETFQLSPLHRYVRHPWYALALVLIWTRDMNLAMLVTAVMITAYFIIGSRLEERKLIAYHGEVYQRYRQHVPALLPLPGRHLTREQAKALLDADRRTE